jgi:hypothetical protein
MYIFGGRGSEQTVFTDLWCYDIEANVWHEIAVEEGTKFRYICIAVGVMLRTVWSIWFRLIDNWQRISYIWWLRRMSHLLLNGVETLN